MREIDPYDEPRLVAEYDDQNPDGPDHDFFRALADDLRAVKIVDLGCGTDLLTCTLVQPGRTVVGVDPSATMLSFARRQPGANQVRWLLGNASDLPDDDADLALMTGNVAQVFRTDDEWLATLSNLHSSLRRGGTLAFEARNPATRIWSSWTREQSHRRWSSRSGPMVKWVDRVREHDGLVTYEGHTIFEATGEHLVSHGALRFRSAAALRNDLERSRFAVHAAYGDWTGGPLTAVSAAMVFVAKSV